MQKAREYGQRASKIIIAKSIASFLNSDGGNLIIGALAIHVSLTGQTKKFIFSSLIGVLTAAVFLYYLYSTSTISIVTIGIPLILSQFVVALHMYMVYYKSYKYDIK